MTSSPSAPTIIRTLDASITTFSRPFSRFSVFPVGIRMSAVRLGNGDLFLLSPTPLDAPTTEKLEQLGGVKYLVCPNVVHHLYVGEYKKRWPEAKIIGVPGLREKRNDLEFDGIMGEKGSVDKLFGFENEIEHRHFAGSGNQDTLYLHRPTNTLLTADLLFNMPPTDQYPPGHSFNVVLRAIYSTLKPNSGMHRFFSRYLNTSNVAEMRKDVKYIAENWRFERIVPCHGGIIEEGGEQAFREAFAWYL
ncbi:hypothetical protein SpCBS45565_g03317 [Spizellomyces sp. 'palustris']|nr:hypothetical protein SpCBS45565_g03317 [Spizellomyces sp. 'palustris']